MRSLAATTLGLATAFATFADAHSIFTTFFINDVNQGDGTCVRMPKDSNTCTSPIAGITSNEMACGRDGQNPVAFTCPAPSGAKLTFEWRLWADASQPGSIDISHKGPCAVYLKQVPGDYASTPAAGAGWFKIWHSGYDETAKKWCTEKLIDNNGLMSVQLPPGLPGGNYLVRPELLALHEADKGDPQFYTGCAQVAVAGPKGTLQVPDQYQASIPGYVQPGTKSVSFNIWASKLDLPYPIPGPDVFYPSAPAGQQAASSSSSDVQQVSGAVPATCLLKVANWCGQEVPSYSDEKGCYAASDNCFQQLNTCYSTAPPTGSKGCQAWEKKCDAIQDGCAAGSFSGPPNKGVKLSSVDAPVPGAIPAVDGMVNNGPVAVLNGATSGNDAAAAAVSGAAAPVVSAPNDAVSPGGAASSSSNDGAASTVGTGTATQPAASVAAVPTTLVPQQKPTSSAAAQATTTSGGASSDDDSGDNDDSGSDSGSGSNTSTNTASSNVSTDGRCGAKNGGKVCKDSPRGDCCSAHGWCGSSRWHCAVRPSGKGCQADFGVCATDDGSSDGKSMGQLPHVFGFGRISTA